MKTAGWRYSDANHLIQPFDLPVVVTSNGDIDSQATVKITSYVDIGLLL